MSAKATILIVDDTPANLQLLITMLETEGYDVRPAKSAHLALNSAQKAPPDLILLDIDLPDMDGYAICRTLKQNPLTREIPIIFISALGSPDEKLRAFRAGGVDFIGKPFHVEEVMARVETHLALRYKQREIERQHRVAASLRHILKVLNSNVPLDEILDEIVGMAGTLLGGIAGAICGVIPESGWRVHAAQGLTIPATPPFLPLWQQIEQVQYTLQPITLAQIQSEDEAQHFGLATLGAMLAVPLAVKGQPDGCLVIYYDSARSFAESEIHLALTFGEQAALAIENARLQQQVHAAAIFQERSRLARELHDSVTQQLYSLSLLTEGWRRIYARQGTLDLPVVLDEVGEIAQQSLREMRLLIYQLRPPTLQAVGLMGALRERLELVERRAGLQTHLHGDAFLELPPVLEENLYWIAQEALNNALKHAYAQEVRIGVYMEQGFLTLQIVDNGVGFDSATVAVGIGLRTMQERADAIGAKLEFLSEQGTHVYVRVQVPSELD